MAAAAQKGVDPAVQVERQARGTVERNRSVRERRCGQGRVRRDLADQLWQTRRPAHRGVSDFNYIRLRLRLEYVCTCVHFKDFNVCNGLQHCLLYAPPNRTLLWAPAWLLLNSCSQRSFGCAAGIAKYSFEIEPQLMITTMSKFIPNVSNPWNGRRCKCAQFL